MRMLILAAAVAAFAAAPALAEDSGQPPAKEHQWYKAGIDRDMHTPVSPALAVTAIPTAVLTTPTAILIGPDKAANLKYQSGIKGAYEECWDAYRAKHDWWTSAFLGITQIMFATCVVPVIGSGPVEPPTAQKPPGS